MSRQKRMYATVTVPLASTVTLGLSVPYPPFHIFVKFIDGISKIRNAPSFVYESYDVRNKKDVGQSFKVLSRKTEVKDSSPKHLKQIQCPIH